jgi:hypothetical protein
MALVCLGLDADWPAGVGTGRVRLARNASGSTDLAASDSQRAYHHANPATDADVGTTHCNVNVDADKYDDSDADSNRNADTDSYADSNANQSSNTYSCTYCYTHSSPGNTMVSEL